MQYPDPTDAFGITVDGGPSLLEPGKTLLRVGIQARRPPARDERKRAVLTFVLDVSGSMQQPNKLDLVKDSMSRLVNALRPDDAVQIGREYYADGAGHVVSDDDSYHTWDEDWTFVRNLDVDES